MGLSLGICGFVLNFAYHSIVTNRNDQTKLFSDMVSFNTVQIWVSLLLYSLFVDSVTPLQFIFFICSIFALGWIGFMFDYFATEFTLIKYCKLFASLSLVAYMGTLLVLLIDTMMTINTVYYICLNIVAFYGINVLMDNHIAQKLALMYP